ncbi:Ubiquinone biosynthesis O-methyltransferase, mitochondrial [Sesamum alatum]|uniref:Ubiquinone biosynthesis O-methyltransferase, mitochondrial n=1 Tax=Sesamum alatum TaxID=300844 RepID=A0AAE1YZB8_9LAMI|nr:Ubiquinone biosynthesis O-methyltransferase, mitochondrial [Sesamum alatum]
MASKHLLARLRTLTRPAFHYLNPRFLYPNPNSLHEHQTRTYSDAPQPSPAAQALATPPGSSLQSKSSLNEAELKKFAAIAETWWDAEGPFKPLHVMNPTRLAFIRSTLCRHFGKDPNCMRPFEGLKFVDVGCGGGILSEPLARMGATVTGVDAVEKNIKIARLHADLDPVTSSIDYCCTTAEKLVEEQRKFDAVFALEVIEHVADPAEFCKSLSALTNVGGATIISTINRSMRAYATAILLAEYILHWLPMGTHQWSSFLTPEELVLILDRASISVQEMAGFTYNPLTRRWYLSDDISVNFIAYGTKNSE